MKKDKIKDDILRVWDHAGLDAEMDARQLAKELNKDPDLKKAGSRSGRQLQHAQVGEAFGREGVLGAISKNVDGISLKDIATKNNVAAKKINAGLITKIVYSLIGNNSSNALYFPVMWKPIINYFLGKLFGDKKITKEEYERGIKGTLINEGYEMKIDKHLILEGFAAHLNRNKGKYLAGAALAGTVAAGNGQFGDVAQDTVQNTYETYVEPVNDKVMRDASVIYNNSTTPVLDKTDIAVGVGGGILGAGALGTLAAAAVPAATLAHMTRRRK